MRRFEFRQAALLRLRHQLRRHAEMKVMKAQARVVRAQQEVDRLSKELDRLSQRAAAGVDQVNAVQWYQSSVLLQAAMTDAKVVVQECETARKAELSELTRATQEVEVLEALRLRRWQHHRKEVARDQTRKLDEIAMRQWFQHHR